MAVSLQVRIDNGKMVKRIRVPSGVAIGEALRDIRDKSKVGGADHALFLPPDPKKNREFGRWLENNRTLASYDITAEDTVDYKKKHRQLAVKLVDGTKKKALVDESKHVENIIEVLCEKLSLPNPEEFSLYAVELKKWANTHKTLAEQGITENMELLLNKRFFATDANVDENDPIGLHLLYAQCAEMIRTGKMLASEKEVIQLAGFQCQITYGDYSPKKHKVGFLERELFLPPRYCRQSIEKKVWSAHAKIVRMSAQTAKYRYVQLCRSLELYGMTLFKVGRVLPNKKKPFPMFLGLMKDKILFLDIDTYEVKKSWQIEHLKRWVDNDTEVLLDFGDHAPHYFTFKAPDPAEISSVISGYIDIILKRFRDPVRQFEEDDFETAEVEHAARPATGYAIAANTPNFVPQQGSITPQPVFMPQSRQPMMYYQGPHQLEVNNKKQAQQAVGKLLEGMKPNKHGAQFKGSAIEWKNAMDKQTRMLQKELKKMRNFSEMDVKPSKQEIKFVSQSIIDRLAEIQGLSAKQPRGMAPEELNCLGKAAHNVAMAVKSLFDCMGPELSEPPPPEVAQEILIKTGAILGVLHGTMADDPSRKVMEESSALMLAQAEDFLITCNKIKGVEGKWRGHLKKMHDSKRQLKDEVDDQLMNGRANKDKIKELADKLLSFMDKGIAMIDQKQAEDRLKRKANNFAEAAQFAEEMFLIAEPLHAISRLDDVGVAAFKFESDIDILSKGDRLRKGKHRASTLKPARKLKKRASALLKITNDAKPSLEKQRAKAIQENVYELQMAHETDLPKMKKIIGKITTLVEPATGKILIQLSKGVIGETARLATMCQDDTLPKDTPKLPSDDAKVSSRRVVGSLMDLGAAIKQLQGEPDNVIALNRLLNAVDNAAPKVMNLVGKSKKLAAVVPDKAVKSTIRSQIQDVEVALMALQGAKKAAKGAALNDEIDQQLETLRSVMDGLEESILLAAAGKLPKTALRGDSVERISDTTKQIMKAFQTLKDSDTMEKKVKAYKDLASKVNALSLAIKHCASEQPNKEAQEKVLKVGKDTVDSMHNLACAIAEEASGPEKDHAEKKVNKAVKELWDVVQKPLPNPCEDAIHEIEEVKRLFGSDAAARPLHRTDMNVFKDLQKQMELVNKSSASFYDDAKNGNDLGDAANELSKSLAKLFELAQLAADLTDDPEHKRAIERASKALANKAIAVLSIGSDENNFDTKSLLDASNDMAQSLRNLTKALADASNKSVDEASKDIKAKLANYKRGAKGPHVPEVAPSTMKKLKEAAERINGASNRLVTATKKSEKKDDHAKAAADGMKELLDQCVNLRDFADDPRTVTSVDRNVINASNHVLEVIENACMLKTTPEHMNLMKQNVKNVELALQKLLKAAASIIPETKELEKATEDAFNDVNDAAFKAGLGSLDVPKKYKQLANPQEDFLEVIHKIDDVVPVLYRKDNLADVKADIMSAKDSIEQVAPLAIACADKEPQKDMKEAMLNATRDMCESLLSFIESFKETDEGDPEPVKNKVEDLIAVIENQSTKQGKDSSVEKIESCTKKLDRTKHKQSDKYTFPLHVARANKSASGLITKVSRFNNKVKSGRSLDQMPEDIANLVTKYTNSMSSAIRSVKSKKQRDTAKKSAVAVTKLAAEYVQDGINGDKAKVADKQKKLKAAIVKSLNDIKEAGIVEKSCDDALEHLEETLGQLELTTPDRKDKKLNKPRARLAKKKLTEIIANIDASKSLAGDITTGVNNRSADVSEPMKKFKDQMASVINETAQLSYLPSSFYGMLLNAAKKAGDGACDVVTEAKNRIEDSKDNNEPMDTTCKEFEGMMDNLKEKASSALKDVDQSLEHLVGVSETLENDAEGALEAASKRLQQADEELKRVEQTVADLERQGETQVGTNNMVTATAIIDSARAIMSCSQVLLLKATLVQEEIGLTKKTNVYKDDPKWAEGLKSAAESVAVAVYSLVHESNALCHGEKGPEILTVCAREVNANTQQLVLASKAKADPDSEAQAELMIAAKNVNIARDKLRTTAEMVEKARQLELQRKRQEQLEKQRNVPKGEVGKFTDAFQKQIEIEELKKKLQAKEQEFYKTRRREYQEN